MGMIDLRTVMLVSCGMLAIMGVVMVSAHRDLPDNIRGTGLWALGSLVLSASCAVVAMRDWMPGAVSVIVADASLLGGLGLWLVGVQRFFERKSTPMLIALSVVVGLAVVVWGTLIQPSYHLRLAAMVLVMAGLNATQLGLFLHHGIRHVSTCFIALVLSVQLLVLLMRGATIYWPGHDTTNVFSATVPQVLFVGTVNLSNMLMAVGFVMLATHRLNLELAWFASRDPLTGLLNRRAFTSSFEQAREDARQAGKALALMILDLDHFKHINDHYGHAVGDLVLVDFCRRVDRVLSEAVPFARIGGEEFAVILRGLKQQEVLSCAERIRDAVAQYEGAPLPLYTCSIGIASMAGEVESLEQLIRAADGALYRAKCAGRNRVEVALAQS